MAKVNTEKVCRTCITEQQQMLNISCLVNCNGTLLTIIKMLNSFVSKEIAENDNFPNFVCTRCVELAVSTYNFKLQCDQSQLILEECAGKVTVIKSDINENIDNNYNSNLQAVHVTIKEESIDSKLVGHNINNQSEVSSATAVQIQRIKQRQTKRTSKIKNTSKFKEENGTEGNRLSTDDLQEIENEISTDLGLIYFCSQCNKSFKNKYIFNAHEKRHEFKGQFLCNVCGKGFSSQSCLNRHNRVHTGEKKYECSECHKRFPSSNNLNLHSRIHSGLKPYLCTVCGKRFSHPTGLTYHMRTHTQEKPYGCELCGKRFAIQCHFDRHKKTHSGERPFACAQCGRAFIKKIDLQRHEEIHTGLKPHSCAICKKSFLRLKNLNYHMMLHTEERPHMCPECGKGFIRSYYLRDHIKKHHT